MGFFGVIERAVAERASTAEIWSALRESAAAAGVELTGVSASTISTLRGEAARIRNARETLARAPGEYALSSDMVANAPWARPLDQQNTLGMYQVRFEHTLRGPEGLTTTWHTTLIRGDLPPTVSQLQALVAEDALHIAAGYRMASVGVGALSVLAV